MILPHKRSRSGDHDDSSLTEIGDSETMDTHGGSSSGSEAPSVTIEKNIVHQTNLSKKKCLCFDFAL